MKAIRIEAFGNPSAAFGAVAQVVEAEQVAEAAAWSAVTPQAAGEVFNVANGETTLTRNFCPFIDSGWVAIGTGEDRREKLVRLTEAWAAGYGRHARPGSRPQAASSRASLLPFPTSPGWPTRRKVWHNPYMYIIIVCNSPVRGHGAQRCARTKL